MCKITGTIYLILKVAAFPIETFSLDIGLHLFLFYVGNFRIHFNVFSSICYCVFAFVSFLSARILLVFLFCYFYFVSVSISFSILLFVICICYLYLLFVFRYLYLLFQFC